MTEFLFRFLYLFGINVDYIATYIDKKIGVCYHILQQTTATCPQLTFDFKVKDGHAINQAGTLGNKYSLLMHCIKIKSPAKFLLNEQYVFVGGNIYFLCVPSCSSEEA